MNDLIIELKKQADLITEIHRSDLSHATKKLLLDKLIDEINELIQDVQSEFENEG